MSLIKVMTWNILFKEKIENIEKLVKEISPDILCCQELTSNCEYNSGVNTAGVLAKKFSYNYFFKSADYVAANKDKFLIGNGIFSKFPLIKKRGVLVHNGANPSSGHPNEKRVYIEAVAKLGEKELAIGTTHLAFTPWFEISPNRRTEADALIAEIKRHNKLYIIMGDFNAKPGSYTINQVEKYLESAGPAYNQKTFTTQPFSYMGMEATGLDWRIDYIFTTRDIQVLSSEIIKKKYSEHVTIIAKIEV